MSRAITQVIRLWKRALSRRSQKGRVTWERMARIVQRWLPSVHIVHPLPRTTPVPSPVSERASCASVGDLTEPARRHLSLPVLLFLCLASVGMPGATRPRDRGPLLAFVTNGTTDSVSILDLSAHRYRGFIRVGKDPTAIRRRPSRDELYVVNSGSDSVTVLDPAEGRAVLSLPTGRRPYQLEFAPDGDTAYVPDHDSASLSVLDCVRRRRRATVPVGGSPAFARPTPDGRLVCVTVGSAGSLVLVDAQSDAVAARIPVGAQPHAVAVTSDSSKAFVGHEDGVAVVDLREHRLLAQVRTGAVANDLALDDSDTGLFVTNVLAGTVTVIDAVTHAVTRTLTSVGRPNRILPAPHRRRLFISDFTSDRVLVMDHAGAGARSAVRVGPGSDTLVLTPKGDAVLVLVASAGKLAVIDARTLARVALLPAGPAPRDLALVESPPAADRP